MPVFQDALGNSMSAPEEKNVPAWVNRGKTIKQLIRELGTFEDQDMKVVISLDGGATHKQISLVGRQKGNLCVLMNCE